MRKVIILLAGLLSASISSQAQSNVRFGLKGGANLTHGSLEANSISNTYLGPGFYAGGLMEVSFPKGSKFKFQPELLFQYHSLIGDNNNVRLGTISIPVAFKYFPIPDFSLMLGPVFNFNVIGANVAKPGYNVVKFGNSLNAFQPGIFFGANYYIHKGLFLDARYTYNFMNIADLGDRFTYGNVSLGIGYKF